MHGTFISDMNIEKLKAVLVSDYLTKDGLDPI